MDLGYSEFQSLLRSTAHDFVQRDFPMSRLRQLAADGVVYDAETWQRMAGLQWLGLMIPSEDGGSGGSWVDLLVLLEEMGKGLLPQAFLAHTLACLAVVRYGTPEQRARILPGAASGARNLAIAVTEPGASLALSGILCQASADADGYRLTGTKHFVRGVAAAGQLLVLCRLGDSLGLFLLDKESAGVELTALKPISGEDQARVALSNVRVSAADLVGGQPVPWAALQEIVSWGALLECGYAVGVMAADADMTSQYVKNRVQFGRPLGSFQAVQHQVADQATDLDCSRLLTLYAACAMDEGRATAPVAVARAKAWVSDALRRVSRTGNQLHGGIGFATEYDLYLYFQQAKTCELMFGDADTHREAVASSLLDS